MGLNKRKLAIVVICFWSMFIVACTKEAEKSQKMESESENVDAEFVGECGYMINNQLWDYSKRFDKVYQWGEGVYFPFEKLEGGEISFEPIEEGCNWGSLAVNDVSDDALENYIVSMQEQGYSVWEGKDSASIYKDGIIMFLVYDTETIYPYIYTGNVKDDRDVSLSEARNLIEEQELLKGYEYFNEYCVIAIENSSIREKGLYEFIVTSVRNDESIYNQPYYLITDGEKVYLFEQEVWQVAYPATANIFEEELILTYVKSQQGDGPDCYVGTYALEGGAYVQKSEKKVSNGIDTLEGTGMVVGRLVDGEYKLYKIRRNEEADFPVAMRNLWVLGEEYNIKED